MGVSVRGILQNSDRTRWTIGGRQEAVWPLLQPLLISPPSRFWALSADVTPREVRAPGPPYSSPPHRAIQVAPFLARIRAVNVLTHECCGRSGSIRARQRRPSSADGVLAHAAAARLLPVPLRAQTCRMLSQRASAPQGTLQPALARTRPLVSTPSDLHIRCVSLVIQALRLSTWGGCVVCSPRAQPRERSMLTLCLSVCSPLSALSFCHCRCAHPAVRAGASCLGPRSTSRASL